MANKKSDILDSLFERERPFLFYKKVKSGGFEYAFLSKHAKKISWDKFEKFVSREDLKHTYPFELYFSKAKPRSINMYKEYTPYLVGEEYITKVPLLFQYGTMFIFCWDGNELWYKKAKSDILKGRTRDKIREKLLSNRPSKKVWGVVPTLTEDQVLEIKYGFHGKSDLYLAQKYNVSSDLIGLIKSGERWIHI